jgi:Spy/CpxP family protein refolding chaperone
MDFGLHRNMRQPSFDTPAGKVRYFERLQKELDLTPAQSDQMRSVLNDFWMYYRTVLSDGKDKIDQILTPEQRGKFDRLLQNDAQR